ncbi:hypothetical protein DPMN_081685 [Dreissena polymorpha]|uniref:Uncharacterized protein n=1 Tax=Dreissena polymorpha TaxID=45954 RepID=A0A9D3Y9D5_DREPO|nr:hypothetical protein DPMN_081685 [Dreissena polymorpha]
MLFSGNEQEDAVHTKSAKVTSTPRYAEKADVIDIMILWGSKKNAPFFQQTGTIFELIQDIIRTNVPTKFHEDCSITVTSRVLTRKTTPPPLGHVFQPTETIFELVPDIIGTNLLTKFKGDRIMNVASKVLIRKMLTTDKMRSEKLTIIRYTSNKNVNKVSLSAVWKNALVPCGHVFQQIVFTRKNALPTCGHLHEDCTKAVTSRSFTGNASPSGNHVFQPTQPESFSISSKILLRQNVYPTSRVLTSQILTRHDEQQAKCDNKSSI